jgi:tripartite-type tricarboxylate transporter receptor subunit TctC
MKQRLGKEGAEPVTMSIPEFSRYIEAETERWAKVVKSANISVD